MASIFSRSLGKNRGNDNSNDTRSAANQQVDTDECHVVDPHAAIHLWREELIDLTASRDKDLSAQLTISSAHPGGLAQLFANHPTRLSNLVRESASQQRAIERCRAIIVAANEVTAFHGIGPVHLAIGRASWTENGQRVTAPAFMRPLRLTTDGEEILLTLHSGTTISAPLSDALTRAGITVNLSEIMQTATTLHGFSSTKALAALREAAGALEAFDLRDELIIGIFEHPAGTLVRELEDEATLLRSSFVRALAGDPQAQEALDAALPEGNPHDRDPHKELGAGDLSPRQHDAIEAAAAGRSFVIDIPQGGDDTTVIGALLADAAAKGKSTLFIGGTPARIARAEARLAELGLSDIAARVDGTPQTADALRETLRTALAAKNFSESQATTSFIDTQRARLTELRETLTGHISHLHRPFKNFGVSAYDALQVLTDLTGSTPKPRTKVRLREEILLDIASDRGQRARDLLHRAAVLGIFNRSGNHSAWQGIVINSTEQVPGIMEVVTRLSQESLPDLRILMSSVAAETGVRHATSIEEWDEQLTMFAGVRDVLDIFQPRIFERSAADMVIATASKQWRADHGITMKRAQRVRLTKQARDMLRPGAHVKDLHSALITVQERREVWRKHCDADGWPTLPQRIDEAVALTQRVRDDLATLAPIFATSSLDMRTMPFADLVRLFDRLAADPSGAQELPKRVAVLAGLKELGLDTLMQDLLARRVHADVVDAELDLSWWASVLGLMIAADPRLGGFDPQHLGAAVDEARDLDIAQVASLPAGIAAQVAARRREIILANPNGETDVQSILSQSLLAMDMFAKYPLVRALVPVVLTVPTLVPWMLPEGASVDLLILDDVDPLPLPSLIPLIARARQIVVIGDVEAAQVGGAFAKLAALLPSMRMDVVPAHLNDQVALLLARHGFDHSGIPVPWTAATAPVTAVWVEGTGMPAPGVNAVESTTPEVQAVVEQVLDHAVKSPEKSLMVVALNDRHAARIRSELDREVAANVGLGDFFTAVKLEPFVVVGPAEARGLSRDRVIIAVGFGKTPHGRVIHDFGEISTASGASLMTGILATVRGDVTVVSSLRASDLDRNRLTVQGAQMLVDLLEIAEGQHGRGADAWPTLEAAPDRLLVDLAERLYGMGLEVVPNVGIPGGVRIPLAIGHPEVPGRLLVAVLTDDVQYVAQPSQRMRDRLVPAMLEAQGWKVHIALSMPVFIDPAKEAEAIVQTVLDAVDEATMPQFPTVNFPSADELAAEFDEAVPDDIPESLEAGAVADEAASEFVDDPADSEQTPESGTGDDDSEDARLRELEVPVTASEPAKPLKPRGPRPAVAQGLPLAAYGDDQLDELAQWIRSDGAIRTQDELVEELREALALNRRGAQTDAVLANVIRRTNGQ